MGIKKVGPRTMRIVAALFVKIRFMIWKDCAREKIYTERV